MRKQKASETPFSSIFDRFGSHLGLPKRSQDAQKSMSKWHQNLISFWRPLGTRFFRPKRRQDAPAPQIAAEDGVGPSLVGEDLGGGKQEPLRRRSPERDKKKNPETWWPGSARRPELGGGLRRLTPRYRRANLLGLQEGFKNGFQNGAESGGQFGVILAVLAALGALLGRLGGILRHLGAVLAHRRPSRRLWGGSWGQFWVILAHLGGVFRAQDRPKFLPRRPKMPLRGLQDSPRFDF